MPLQKNSGARKWSSIFSRFIRCITEWLVSRAGTTETITFTIKNARESDCDRLYDFVFDKPDPNVLRRSRQEVRKMVEEGVFFVVIREDTGRIVGSCYLKGSDETGEWEFGGAYIDPEHRTHGLFRILALASIIAHFTVEPEAPLIAHVLSGNPGPVQGLESLMFQQKKARERFQQGALPGIEHMQPDADGFVYADTYEFRRDDLICLVCEAESFRGAVLGKDGVSRRIQIRLRAFEDSDVLYRLRTYLERKNS